MNALTRLINAELARDGLRLAYDHEPAWLEPSSAGLVRATDADIAGSQDLVSLMRDWNRAAMVARMAAARGIAASGAYDDPPIVTAQMLADTWCDDDGPARVRAMLAALPEADRHRLVTDYWNLMRRRGHGVSLVETAIQFCIVEWLAA